MIQGCGCYCSCFVVVVDDDIVVDEIVLDDIVVVDGVLAAVIGFIGGVVLLFAEEILISR